MGDESTSTWQFYCTPAGSPVVQKEIHETLNGKPPLIELSRLMWRIEHGEVLDRDIGVLGKGLNEARLTHAGNEYRLYFAIGHQGDHLLLGLKFHKKGGRGAQKQAIAVARDRLAEWRGRI